MARSQSVRSTNRFTNLRFEQLEDRAVPSASLNTALRLAVGVLENGASHVKVYESTGTLLGDIDVSSLAGTGQVSVATGDVTGDGTQDIVVGSGSGVQGEFRVFDGKTLQQVFSSKPFGSFSGGVNVAVGDLTGDGIADIAVTPDRGGGPRVEVYRGGDYTQVANFLGIADPNFRGGARVAIGDINHDGTADLVVAAGYGGGPRVAVIDGKTILSGSPTSLTNDFFAFPDALRNGVFVAVGDINGDGYGDIVIGAGPGGGPQVLVISGHTLMNNGAAAAVSTPLANFFAGDPNGRGGVPVSTTDLNGDGTADVIAGGSLGSGGSLIAYSGTALTSGAGPTTLFQLTADPGTGTALSSIFPAASTGGTPSSGGTTSGGSTTPAAGNALITLKLNPLSVNLLGLEVDTSPITVTVSAAPGNGALLGNVLTLASNLVNLKGTNDALNNVLGGVVNLLNSASLSVTGVASSGPLSTSTAAAAITPILDLYVAPVHLNLLGALVDTSPIHLTIKAQSGSGLILGNVIADLANLFNPPLPAQLDLPTVNAKLQQLLSELNSQIPGISSATTTTATAPAGVDRVLSLDVPPINLNLLGLNLVTSEIRVNADAQTGNGLLLGNVLTTLLNTLGATPEQLTQLSNNLNAVLAKVVGVLNASNLTLASGTVAGLAPALQTLISPTLVNTTGNPATAPILNLAIASTDGTTPPVDVNLLGLNITTSNIRAQLLAQTGNGQILGNLLYNAANLLNPGGTLNLLGILGQLAL